MKTGSLYDQLLITFASLGVLSACGSSQAPVNATEVPETPASSAPVSAQMPPDATASPVDGATGAPLASAAPSAAAPASSTSTSPPKKLPDAKDMPKGNHTQQVTDSKRKKACEASCGEGTCGSPCPK